MTTTADLQDGSAGFAFDRLTPEQQLPGPKPKINSREDLALALREISWIHTRRKTVEARIEQQINVIRDQAKSDLQIDVHGAQLTFNDREQALRDAASKFILSTKMTFDGDTKQAKFPYCTVAKKDQAPTITFKDDKSKKDVVAAITEKHELAAKAVTWLQRLKLLPWIKITFDLDITAIKKAMKEKKITKAELAKHSMEYTSETIVVITPNDYAAAQDAPPPRGPSAAQ